LQFDADVGPLEEHQMSFIKIGEYTINSRYIQYAKEHHGKMVITFGEGSATESTTISKEEWEAVQRSIAFFEGAPPPSAAGHS
jgi:hypothetical protein